jgi:hypothetical protein
MWRFGSNEFKLLIGFLSFLLRRVEAGLIPRPPDHKLDVLTTNMRLIDRDEKAPKNSQFLFKFDFFRKHYYFYISE